MNKHPLLILTAFILGVSSTALFAQINLANNDAVRKVNPLSQGASVAGTVDADSAVSTSINIPAGAVVAATTTPKRYEYKLLRDVDLCTMNKLGTQGWQAFQFGGTIESAYGYDENCKNGKMYDVLDWVLFSRDSQ